MTTFGLIAITGARIWVENRVDFTKGANLFVGSIVLIVGAADYTLRIGDFELAGIGIGTFGAIVLYQLVKHAPGGGGDPEAPADAVVSPRGLTVRFSAQVPPSLVLQLVGLL